MNYKLFSLLSLLAGLAASALSQSGGDGYPFDTPTDPRSVSMGESFVAVPANPSALMYNPAGLAGLSGLNVSYSRKNLDWVSEGLSFYSMNAAVSTSFGVFAAQYNRYLMGTIPVTTELYPDGNGSEMTLYSHDVAVGYAYRLAVGLALGAAAKYYDFVESISGPLNGGMPPWTSTPAYLFDFGITYTLPRLHSQEAVEDSITVGLSYQNVGSRWKIAYPQSAYQGALMEYDQNTEEVQLPEYFRIGVSYAMRIQPPEKGGLSPFAALLTAEFRSLQNPVQTGYEIYWPSPVSPETSYWGFGLECTVFEFLSLRGGAAFRPFESMEGDRDRPSFRYGAGIHIPVQRIGVDIPLTASIQYTVVPAVDHGYYLGPPDRTGTFPVFSIDIQYSGSPW